MKTKTFLTQFISLLAFHVVCSVIFCSFRVGNETDKTVQKAYELRMNGKSDEAKVV